MYSFDQNMDYYMVHQEILGNNSTMMLSDKWKRSSRTVSRLRSLVSMRMMRCIRFATQLNFYIEDETFEALERNAERIKIISGERVEEELNKIMMTPTPSKGFVDLQRCGLLKLIMPELSVLDIVETRGGRAHKNNFYHTLEVLDNVCKKSDNLWLRWAALMHDIGKTKSKRWDPLVGWTFHNHNYLGAKMVPDIFRRMKLPMDAKMKYVQKMAEKALL